MRMGRCPQMFLISSARRSPATCWGVVFPACVAAVLARALLPGLPELLGLPGC